MEENKTMALAEKTVTALAATLQAVEPYVPTKYVDYSEPDIDAEHLNHAENAIKMATDALNLAIGTINTLSSAVDQLNRDIGSGYFKMHVKTATIVLMIRECNFSNGRCSVPAEELFGYIPKWGGGVCQPLILNESVVAPTIAYDNANAYTITLQNKLDYTGIAWITAMVIANIS